MRKIVFVCLAIFLSILAFAEESPPAWAEPSFRLGTVYFGNHLPSPAVTGSISLGQGFYLEGNVGTLLVLGFADVAIRYELPILDTVTPYLGARSGAHYTITESSLYNAATVGVKIGKYFVEADPLWYYRRDFEHSRNTKTEASFLLSIGRDIP